MFSADMAEAFHNVLKEFHPLPRMRGEFLMKKSAESPAEPVIQESQYFDISYLNQVAKVTGTNDDEFPNLEVQRNHN